MIYVWQSIFWGIQLLLWLLCLAQESVAQFSASRWGAASGAVMSAVILVWLLPKAYRSVLWRRRKSVRPSREVQMERRRMTAALHDGIGSQLVHLMRLSAQHSDPVMNRALEQCLLDLRLLVDSMDAQDESLAELLARFRHRLQPVLDRQGVSLHWDVWNPEMLGEAGCLPRGAMAREIMAIVQEAVSNLLQHAEAREVWVSLVVTAQPDASNAQVHACLRIEDDGKGMAALAQQEVLAAETSTGMGLLNMRRRAHTIGGKLEIRPRNGGGTQISISW